MSGMGIIIMVIMLKQMLIAAIATFDVAIVTYKLTSSGTRKGKDFNKTDFASATWVKRDGKWLTVSYTQSKPQTDQPNQQMK